MGMMATATPQQVYGVLPPDAPQAAVTWQTQTRVVLHEFVWTTHIMKRRQLKDALHGRGDTPALRPDFQSESLAMPTPLADASHIPRISLWSAQAEHRAKQ